ncbi:methyltransferase domain-containing protein [Streptomyces sp. NPDC047117]|uniref:methyltransferase domain-containing protein n=1 Tax=unclassified Streptomyces TaxID=2593676 RepID=UPI003401A10B
MAHANDDGYLFDNQQTEAGQRFVAMSELFDHVTFRHLAAVGVTRGWHCWEVGAGSPGVPAWLAARTGPAGRVLATDIDTVWMESDAPYEVVRHDVAAEEPPPGPFDLVHARLVLVHVPERAAALAAMVRALRPGGVLVLEDADPALQPLACPDEHGPAERLANRLRRGSRELLARRGADLAFGRTLPRLLREAGLTDVAADAYFPVTSPACDALEAATVRQLRDRLVEAGLATEAEIEEHHANVTAGRLDLTMAPLISAWGRKPGGSH